MSYIGDRRSTGYLAGSSSTPSKVRATGYSSSDGSFPVPKQRPTHYLALYTDRKGEHRWKVCSFNGKLVAESGEGYVRPSGALRGFRAFHKAMTGGTVDFRTYEVITEETT